MMAKQLLASLGAVGTGILAGGTGALVLFGWMAAVVLHAAEGPIAPFIGTYVGTADVEDASGGEAEQRDMDIVIEPYDNGGFRLTWVNVTRVDGRRDVPGVERRIQSVLFEPSKKGGFYVEVEEENPFRERAQTQPMRGDPVRWAALQDGVLVVYSFVVRDDGRYELQVYERRLTDVGMDIEFRRVVDGEVERRIVGRTVRAVAKSGE